MYERKHIQMRTFACAAVATRISGAAASTTAATTAASQQHQHASLSLCASVCVCVGLSMRRLCCSLLQWCAEDAFVIRLCTQVSGRLGGVNLLTLSVSAAAELGAVRLF